jgi:hypothetical protein
MTHPKPVHPLTYFVAVLSQMTATLKDFDMQATAALLERAKTDIEKELERNPQKAVSEAGKMSPREGRL